MIVLGIDPGRHLGMALLEMRAGGMARLLVAETIDTGGGRSWKPLLHEALGRASLVAIETIRTVYPRERFSARMATAIAHASQVAGQVHGEADARGLRVVEVTASAWRRALCSRATASDRLVAALVPPRIAGWPRRSSAHERDAAGVALYAAEGERLAALERARRGEGG